jgi:hypothetical protein
VTLPTPTGPVGDFHGVTEVQGPLIRQPEPAARLARILNHAATELWDLCTFTDAADMWEEARAIASRILASCPMR